MNRSKAFIGQTSTPKVEHKEVRQVYNYVNVKSQLRRNLINSPFKDTFMNPSAGYTVVVVVVVRLIFVRRAFGYCYIDFHSETGIIENI